MTFEILRFCNNFIQPKIFCGNKFDWTKKLFLLIYRAIDRNILLKTYSFFIYVGEVPKHGFSKDHC